MEEINLEKINKIYFIGIGGIGVSAIARFMKSKGREVFGSDLGRSEVTDTLEKIGVKINYKQESENITDDIDLVIHTASIPEDNFELVASREKGLSIINYAQSLGLIFNNKFGISICGTHGKSTTTAIAGGVLEGGNLDPSVLVGSIVPRYESNLHIGSSDYFVAESCEYQGSFLELTPQIIILNNIELDHTDCYENIEKMKEVFRKFVSKIKNNGILIYNGDDKNVLEVASFIKEKRDDIKIISFGKDESCDVRLMNFTSENGKTEFEVSSSVGSLKSHLKFPGEFNVYNSLAAIALGVELNVSLENISESLKNFSGIWRRFEIKGEYNGNLVISDYAHHPTAVRKTIEAAKNFYPDKNIFAIFQPHQHNRTKNLYKDFLESFDDADKLLLVEIYDVAGREETEDQDVSSKKLAEDLKVQNKEKSNSIFYASNLQETKEIIKEKVNSEDIILIMGAGDIYKVANELVLE